MESGINKALLNIQKDLPQIKKGKVNPFFNSKYVDLNELLQTLLPIANKNGIVLVQSPSNIEGKPALKTQIIHAESGESLESVSPLLLIKEDPQGQGSAITYARRYALMSIFGLVGEEDDDGNKATSGTISHQEPKPPTDKQKKFLNDLFLQKVPGGDIRQWMLDEHGIIPDEITSQQVSDLIEELKGE